MKNDIIGVIENHEGILKLFDKVYMVRNEIKDINKKNKVKDTIIFVLIYLASFLLLKETLFQPIILIPLVLIISAMPSLVLFIFFNFFKNFIVGIKKVNKNMIYKGYRINKEVISREKNIDNIIIDFEKYLTDKELELYKNYDYILYNADDTEYFVYDLYEYILENIDIELLSEHKDLIVNKIKVVFSVKDQKELFNLMSSIVEEKNTNNELERLNKSLEKLKLIKVNNVNVENL